MKYWLSIGILQMAYLRAVDDVWRFRWDANHHAYICWQKRYPHERKHLKYVYVYTGYSDKGDVVGMIVNDHGNGRIEQLDPDLARRFYIAASKVGLSSVGSEE